MHNKCRAYKSTMPDDKRFLPIGICKSPKELIPTCANMVKMAHFCDKKDFCNNLPIRSIFSGSRFLFFKWYVLIVCMMLIPVTASAQLSFEVLSVEGSAKVQRSQKRTWEKVQVGQKINDNDLVETFFQTKMIMRFGEKNLVILGSNSKALMNIAPSEKPNASNVNLTLFAGGLFSKVISNSHVNIYTANAVGEIDSGSISTVADSKSSETGFQILGGSALIRNIAQQTGITLRAGLTTMILPNKEPTAPLYITTRHVAVLKHFFGDDYINMELEESGIQPTDEQNSRITFSNSLPKGAGQGDEGIHRTLFSINKIYGSIIDDREQNNNFYKSIEFPATIFNNKGQLHLRTGFAFSGNGTNSSYKLTATQKLGIFDLGLRFNLAQNTNLAMQAGFNSLPGILDKIDHITFGNPDNFLFISLGPIKKYTLGYGLIVDNYSNSNRNSVFQPLGAKLQLGILDGLKLNAFTSDVSLPLTGGAYIGFEPSIYHFGAGYAFDFNQFKHNLPAEAFRFGNMNVSENPFPDQKSEFSNAHIYMVNFATTIFSYYDRNLSLRLEFAQKLFNGTDGFVARLPYFFFNIEKFSFGGGFVIQHGRLLSGLFDSQYHGHRLHIKSGASEFDEDTLITLTNQLSDRRKASGFSLTFNTNPYRGVDISFTWQQDFSNKNSYRFPTDTSKGKDTPGDFSFHLSGSINDSLIPFIKFGELFVAQNHGTTVPYGGSFFRSWDFEAGFYALTKPILFNLAFELGGTLFYFDMGSQRDNIVKSTDFIFELSAGIRWGFR